MPLKRSSFLKHFPFQCPFNLCLKAFAHWWRPVPHQDGSRRFATLEAIFLTLKSPSQIHVFRIADVLGVEPGVCRAWPLSQNLLQCLFIQQRLPVLYLGPHTQWLPNFWATWRSFHSLEKICPSIIARTRESLGPWGKYRHQHIPLIPSPLFILFWNKTEEQENVLKYLGQFLAKRAFLMIMSHVTHKLLDLPLLVLPSEKNLHWKWS